jgi:hypothetical protein
MSAFVCGPAQCRVHKREKRDAPCNVQELPLPLVAPSSFGKVWVRSARGGFLIVYVKSAALLFTPAFTSATLLFSFSTNKMAEKPATPPAAPRLQPAVPVLNTGLRLSTSPLRSSPLREMAHSEPTSAIEKMTLRDQPEEAKAASDAGKQSKFPSLDSLCRRLQIPL